MKNTRLIKNNGRVSLLTQGIKGGMFRLYTQGNKVDSGFSSPFSLVQFKPNFNKVINTYFDITDLYNFTIFKSELSNKLSHNEVYTVFVKVRYNKDNFFMAGNQFGFKVQEDSSFEFLFSDIRVRLEEYFSYYNLVDEDIVYIQVSFRLLDRMVYSDLRSERVKLTTTDSNDKVVKDMISIPVSHTESYLGKPLSTKSDNNIITNVEVKIKGKKVNFLDIISDKAKYLNKHIVFDNNCKFFHIKGEKEYILVIKQIDESNLVKLQYSLSGILLSRVEDSWISEGKLLRSKGNSKLYIKDNSIYTSLKQIDFKPIEKPKNKDISWLPNPNIGVIDVETYLTDNNVYEIYALGFKSNLDTKATTYYIDSNYDSDTLVLNFINELLKTKYRDIKFYCHNLGGYDVVFLLKVLTSYNDKNTNKYVIDTILKDNRVIKLTIKKDNKSLTILDSYCILSNSLAKLGKDFNVETQKSIFPYKFSTQSNLFYKGLTPSIEFYNDISSIEYKEILKKDWCFQTETIKYLEMDLNCLFEVLVQANKQFFKDYKINITDSLTISGLAMKIYLNKYYNNNIPRINKASVYRDIKQAYYGGITEVYRPYGENLFYYDVNSLYPYVSLDVMPGLSCKKFVFYKDLPDINDLFGFFYCKIKAPKDFYIGLLPVRTNLGLEFPVGEWEGWYFSEELKFAKENGYEISVLKGYEFEKELNVFSDYVNSIYKIKSNPNSNTQKLVAKSLLNNLLGRFGINLDKAITEIVSINTFNNISIMNKVVSYKELSNDKILVSYIPKLDSEIIDTHNLDLFKILKKYKDKEIQQVSNSSVVISAAITAYARIHLNKIKMFILSKRKKIYYCDTDSIVTNLKLDKNMVNNELGKLKLEHYIKKAIFVTNKTYCLINENNQFINKAKGVKSNSLNWNDYMKLLNNKNVTTAVKSISKIDWTRGDVRIYDKEQITLNSNSYNKRIKMYQNNKWVNTRPKVLNRSLHTFKQIFINYFDKNLIIYKVNLDNNLILYKVKLQLISYENKQLNLVIYKKFIHNIVIYKLLSTQLMIPNTIYLFIVVYKSSLIKDILIYKLPINGLVDKPELLSGMYNYTNISKLKDFIAFVFSFSIPFIFFNVPDIHENFNINTTIGEIEPTVLKESYEVIIDFEDYIPKLYDYSSDQINESIKYIDENKYIGIEDIRTLFKEDEVSISLNTNLESNKDSFNLSPFTPFTPETLSYLKQELEDNNSMINKIYNNNDKELTDLQRDKINNLLENNKYLMNQETKHILGLERDLNNDVNKIMILNKEVDELITNLNKLKTDTSKLLHEVEDNLDKIKSDSYTTSNKSITTDTTESLELTTISEETEVTELTEVDNTTETTKDVKDDESLGIKELFDQYENRD